MKIHVILLAGLFLSLFAAIGADRILPAFAHEQSEEDGYIDYVEGDNPAGWNIPYEFSMDPEEIPYAIALKVMNPVFKDSLKRNPHPVIGIAEVNLNENPSLEMIAFPVEDEEWNDKFCNDALCPHYVIETKDTNTITLGVLYGWKVNLGKKIVNGYYTLDVYTKPATDSYFEEYAYDPEEKKYRPVQP